VPAAALLRTRPGPGARPPVEAPTRSAARLDLPLSAPPRLQITNEAVSRGRWLVGLMAAQSLSSIILDRYSDLLREHLVITLFLTML
jgi:hypothetical protein